MVSMRFELLIKDFLQGGDLQKRIKDQRGIPFSEHQIFDWFTQICQGMKLIHDRKDIHRDLKGQNIFFDNARFRQDRRFWHRQGAL